MFQIDRLEKLALKQRTVIYNIHKCNAGWGIQWHEQDREDNPPRWATYIGKDSWRNGLVTYRYYDTFEKMILDETIRLEELNE